MCTNKEHISITIEAGGGRINFTEGCIDREYLLSGQFNMNHLIDKLKRYYVELEKQERKENDFKAYNIEVNKTLNIK